MRWWGVQMVFEAENLEEATKVVELIEEALSVAGVAAATLGPGEVETAEGESEEGDGDSGE